MGLPLLVALLSLAQVALGVASFTATTSTLLLQPKGRSHVTTTNFFGTVSPDDKLAIMNTNCGNDTATIYATMYLSTQGFVSFQNPLNSPQVSTSFTISSDLAAGKYVMCYCDSTAADCSATNSSAYTLTVSNLLAIDPDPDAKLAASTLTVQPLRITSLDLTPSVDDRLHAIPMSGTCGVTLPSQIGGLAGLTPVIDTNDYVLTPTTPWVNTEVSGQYHICRCSAAVSGSCTDFRSFAGPVANLLLHDITVGAFKQKALSATANSASVPTNINIKPSSVLTRNDLVYWRLEDTPCDIEIMGVINSMTNYSSIVPLNASASGIGDPTGLTDFDLGATVASRTPFRLCAVKLSSAEFLDFANIKLYLTDATLDTETPSRTADVTHTITSTVLPNTSDKVFWLFSGTACSLFAEAPTAATTSLTLPRDGAGAVVTDFSSLDPRRSYKLCVALGGDYTSMVELSSVVVRPSITTGFSVSPSLVTNTQKVVTINLDVMEVGFGTLAWFKLASLPCQPAPFNAGKTHSQRFNIGASSQSVSIDMSGIALNDMSQDLFHLCTQPSAQVQKFFSYPADLRVGKASISTPFAPKGVISTKLTWEGRSLNQLGGDTFWFAKSSIACAVSAAGNANQTSAIQVPFNYGKIQVPSVSINFGNVDQDNTDGYRLCVNQQNQGTTILDFKEVTIKVYDITLQTTSINVLNQTAATATDITLSWAEGAIPTSSWMWWQLEQNTCNLGPNPNPTTTTSGAILSQTTTGTNVALSFNFFGVRPYTANNARMRLCMFIQNQVADLQSISLAIYATQLQANNIPVTQQPTGFQYIAPTPGASASNPPTPSLPVITSQGLSAFFNILVDDAVHTISWSYSGTTTVGDQLGLFPVSDQNSCSGFNQKSPVLTFDASSQGIRQSSTVSGSFVSANIAPGRYRVCYCQGNGERCGDSANKQDWKTLIGVAQFYEVTSFTQKHAVKYGTTAPVTVFFPGKPVILGVPTGRFTAVSGACGSSPSNTLNIQRITPQLEDTGVDDLYALSIRTTWTGAIGTSYNLCYCNATALSCPSSGFNWEKNYAGPVASVLVHDLTLTSSSIASAADQKMSFAYAQYNVAGATLWFQTQDEQCDASPPAFSELGNSGSVMMGASNTELSLDFSNTLASRTLYRACILVKGQVRDLSDITILVSDLAVSTKTVTYRNVTEITLTSEHVLASGDKVWFRQNLGNSQQGCVEPPSASSLTTEAITLGSAPHTHDFSFDSMVYGAKLMLCVKLGEVPHEFESKTVQVLDTSITLSSPTIVSNVGINTVTLPYTSAAAFNTQDKMWFMREEQACGTHQQAAASIYATNFASPTITFNPYVATGVIDFTSISGAGLTAGNYRLCQQSAFYGLIDVAHVTLQLSSFKVTPTTFGQFVPQAFITLTYDGDNLLAGSDVIWFTRLACELPVPTIGTGNSSVAITASASGVSTNLNMATVAAGNDPVSLCVFSDATGVSSIYSYPTIALEIIDITVSPSTVQALPQTLNFSTTLISTLSLTDGASVWWQMIGRQCNPSPPLNSGDYFTNTAVLSDKTNNQWQSLSFEVKNIKPSGQLFRLCKWESASGTKDLNIVTLNIVGASLPAAVSLPASVNINVGQVTNTAMPSYTLQASSSTNRYFDWAFTGKMAQYSAIHLVPVSTADCSSAGASASAMFWASSANVGGETGTATAGPFDTSALQGRFRMCFCQGSGDGDACDTLGSFAQVGYLNVVKVLDLDRVSAVTINSIANFGITFFDTQPGANARFLLTQGACGTAPSTSITSLFSTATNSGGAATAEDLQEDSTATVTTHTAINYAGSIGTYNICMCNPNNEPGGTCVAGGVNSQAQTWFETYGTVGKLIVHDVKFSSRPGSSVYVNKGITIPIGVPTFKTTYTPSSAVVSAGDSGWWRFRTQACGTVATLNPMANTSTPAFVFPTTGGEVDIDSRLFDNFPVEATLRLCVQQASSGNVLDLADTSAQLVGLIISPASFSSGGVAQSINMENNRTLLADDVLYFSSAAGACDTNTAGIASTTETDRKTYVVGTADYLFDMTNLAVTTTYRLCVIRGVISYDFYAVTLTMFSESVVVTANTVVTNDANQQVRVDFTQSTFLATARFWFSRVDQACEPVGASAFSSDAKTIGGTAITYFETGYNFAAIANEDVTKQKWRLCVESTVGSEVSVLPYDAVTITVMALELSVSSMRISGGSQPANQLSIKFSGGSLAAGDKVWFSTATTPADQSTILASSTTSSIATIASSGAVIQIEGATQASVAPFYLMVYDADEGASFKASPYPMYFHDIELESKIVFNTTSVAELTMSFTANSMSAGTRMYWQQAGVPCYQGADLSASASKSSSAFISTIPSAPFGFMFDFNGVKPSFSGAIFRLCAWTTINQVRDLDSVQINVFSTVTSPPSTAPPSMSAPPTPAPAPTLAPPPTVAPPPTPIATVPFPSNQTSSVTIGAFSTFNAVIEWSYTGATPQYADQLELLYGPTARCGDGVTVPTKTLVANLGFAAKAGTVRSENFDPDLSATGVGGYKICFCQAQGFGQPCDGNLTLPRQQVGQLIIVDSVDGASTAISTNTITTFSVEFTKHDPVANQDRLMLIDADGTCGVNEPSSTASTLQFLGTSASGRTLTSLPKKYATSGVYTVCYCNSVTSNYNCPIAGPSYQQMYGGPVATLIVNDLRFRDSTTAIAVIRDSYFTTSGVAPSYLTLHYDESSSLYAGRTWWLQMVSEACSSYHGSYPSLGYTAIQPFTGSGISYEIKKLQNSASNTMYRACIKQQDGTLLSLDNTGVYINDFTVDEGSINSLRQAGSTVAMTSAMFATAGDSIYFVQEGVACPTTPPTATSLTGSDSATVESGSVDYVFDLSGVQAQKKYRLCYQKAGSSDVIDLYDVVIVPLTVATSLSVSSVLTSDNQRVGFTYSNTDFGAADQIWFERFSCRDTPPFYPGQHHSNLVPPNSIMFLNFTGVEVSLEPLYLCMFSYAEGRTISLSNTLYTVDGAATPSIVRAGTISQMELGFNPTDYMTTGTGNANRIWNFWYQRIGTSCGTEASSSATANRTGLNYYSVGVAKYFIDFSAAEATADRWRLCMFSLASFQGDALMLDLDQVKIAVVKVSLVTTTVEATYNQQVEIQMNSLSIPVNSPVWFVQEDHDCETPATLADRTRTYAANAPDGGDGTAAVTAIFDFTGKNVGQKFRLCAQVFSELTNIVYDLVGESITVVGLEVKTGAVRAAEGQQVRIIYTQFPSTFIESLSRIWFQSYGMSCQVPTGTNTFDWPATNLKSGPDTVYGTADKTYSFNFTDVVVSQTPMSVCVYDGTTAKVLNARGVVVANVNTSTTVVRSGVQPVVLNFDSSSISAGYTQVHFSRTDISCDELHPTLSSDRKVTASASGQPINLDFTNAEGSQIPYRLCLTNNGFTTDINFVQLRVIEVTVDTTAINARADQRLRLTWSGSELAAGNQVYFTSADGCGSSPGLPSVASRVTTVGASGEELSFDFTGATVTGASWGLCVATGALDYRYLVNIMISDVRVSPQLIQAQMASITITAASAASIALGSSMWFHQNMCGSPVTPASSLKTNTVTFDGSRAYDFDFTRALTTGANWKFCSSMGSVTSTYDGSDAIITVSDLTISPRTVFPGSSSIALTFKEGVLRATDRVYFTDAACVSSGSSVAVQASGVAFAYNFNFAPSTNPLSLCVVRGAETIKLSASFVRVLEVSISTNMVRPAAAQTVSIDWATSLSQGDAVFFKAGGCQGSGRQSSTTTVPAGIRGDLVLDFSAAAGSDMALFSLCVNPGGNSAQIIDFGITVIVSGASQQPVSASPVDGFLFGISVTDGSISFGDSLAWVDAAVACPTTEAFQAGFSGSATTSDSVSEGYGSYTFDLSSLAPSATAQSFRLCVYSVSLGRVLDLDLVQTNFDVATSPALIFGSGMVKFEFSGVIDPSFSRLTFVRVGVACPTVAQFGLSQASTSERSSIITAPASTFTGFFDFSALAMSSELRLCVFNAVPEVVFELPAVSITVGTESPTKSPTTSPTKNPTTTGPTAGPTTVGPTLHPTAAPSTNPTVSPTDAPTKSPTMSPTKNPTTAGPTAGPTTSGPTVSPTAFPSTNPTVSPTDAPTDAPTVAPSAAPTQSPSTSPSTRGPTFSPTANPTTVGPTTIGETFSPTPAPDVYELVCNNAPFQASCDVGLVIQVNGASFGRTDKFGGGVCGLDRQNECAFDVTAQLSSACDDKDYCSFATNNQVELFKNDPCPNTFKYLNFTYKCLPPLV